MAARISARYLLARLAASALVLWVTVTLLFVLLKAMPGDVAGAYVSPAVDGADAIRLRRRYGLDDPLWLQYLKWLRNYLLLDLGQSTTRPASVASLLAARLPRTLVLFGSAFLLQYVVGTLAGVSFGWRRGSRTDRSGFLAGITLYSVPFFWIGWLLLLGFAYDRYGIAAFPTRSMTTAGIADYGAVSLLVDVGYHLALPAASLVLVGWAGAMLVTRTAMQEVVDAPYVHTARAKGLPPAVVKYKHAARNALIPVVTQGLIGVAFIVDGAVVVEHVFSWPGMGDLLVEAIRARDFPVAFGAFFLLAVLVVAMHLLLDAAYTYLDPRIRFGERE